MHNLTGLARKIINPSEKITQNQVNMTYIAVLLTKTDNAIPYQ